MKRPAEVEGGSERAPKSLRSEDSSSWDNLPGMIERVVLRHFMCHQEFVYSPTRRVNFVAGQNGSGKSAVLTGVLFGLGAKARDLGKSSLKDLIREGSNTCSVEVTLLNTGENGYRKEDFGGSITVVRSSNRSGGNAYKFKDAKGHIVAVKKPSRELNRLLSAFSIQITNPVTILMQDTAKTLLKDATEKKLYTFFMLATQLEDCKKFYSSANEKKLEAETRLQEKVGYKEKLEKEYRKWKKEFDFLQSIESRRKDIKGMKAELAWSIVKELEAQERQSEAAIEALVAKTLKYDSLSAEKDAAYTELKMKKSKKDEELTHFTEIESSLQEEKATAKDALVKADAGVKASSRKLEDLKRREKELDGEISELSGIVKRLKAKGVSESEEKHLAREAVKERLAKEISTAKSKVDTAVNHLQSIEKTIQGIEEKTREKRHEMSAAKSKMEAFKAKIKTLQELKDNNFAVYGREMVKLVNAVQENRKIFKRMPIGPIGAYIRFKSGVQDHQKILVDSEIRKNLNSFIFDSYEDKALFDKFARSYNFKGAKYVSKFKKEVYDVNRKKPPTSSSSFPTVFDLLEFEDPNVANCLIDHCKIERVALLPNESVAQKVFSDKAPANCNYGLVYSEEKHCTSTYYSAPYRSYMGARLSQQLLIQSNVRDHLKSLQRELESSREEYRSLEADYEELKSGGIKLHHEERSRTSKQIRDQERILANKSAELNIINVEERTEEAPMDVVVMEEDLEGCLEKKEAMKEEREALAKSHSSLKDAYTFAQRDYHDKDEKLSLKSSESLERAMASLQSDMSKILKEKGKISSKRVEVAEAISSKKEDKEKLAAEVAKHLEKAVKWSPERIDTERSKDEIYNKIQAAEQSLKERQERAGVSPEKIVAEYGRVGTLFRDVTDQVDTLGEKINRLGETLEIRKQGFVEIRKSVCRRIKMAFSMRLSARNYVGELGFDHKEAALSMSVNPEGKSSSKGGARRGLKTLSGGEKSYATVALILALWDSMHPPFRIMDEFDVFMDNVNRRVALDLIISIATDTRKYQYIFLTPLSIDNIDVSDDVSILKLVKNSE